MSLLNDSYCAFLNLDSRKDRFSHMQSELMRIGIAADRVQGKTPDYYGNSSKYETMRKRTPGAIGCHMGQRQIMMNAFIAGRHALVMEDDIVFCDDFNKRLQIIEKFLSENEWDVFWFGGTYHKEPTWHRNPHHNEISQCTCNLNKDFDVTDNKNIVRTYGAFSTFCYLVNKDSIAKIIDLLDENVHQSMGIDWLFILLQPQLKTFAFDPGCVKQYDNQSNIGNGMTYFSGFEKLGPHWFQNKMA